MIKLMDILNEELTPNKISNVADALITMGVKSDEDLTKLFDDLTNKVSDKDYMKGLEKEKKDKEKNSKEASNEKETTSKSEEFLISLGVNIDNISKNKNGNIIVDQSIEVEGGKFTNLQDKLSNVNGNIKITKSKLSSLTNFPYKVEGDVILNDNISLTSLKGISKIINGNLILTNCDGLYKLDDFPEKVKNVDLTGITKLNITNLILKSKITGTITVNENTFNEKDLLSLQGKFKVDVVKVKSKKSFLDKITGK